jgi:predicted HD superfamily hydrolase involved in NAD metabolism
VTSGIEDAIGSRLEPLPEGLRRHIYRVQKVALELARQHEVDGEKTRLAALAHDIARAMKGEDLLRKARELGIAVHPVEAEVPILLHGPVAAETLRLTDGLEDQDIYEAVYWHSTAREGLGPAAKVVYLADKLDPQKVSRYPFLPELRALAMKSLDRAILEFLSRELVSLLRQGSLVHPTSVEARNELVLNLTHNRSHGGQHG